MQARFYAPWYGRFLSPDPARDQHFEETQSWNIYSYVQNNPVMNTDPTGMFMEELKAYAKGFGAQFARPFVASYNSFKSPAAFKQAAASALAFGLSPMKAGVQGAQARVSEVKSEFKAASTASDYTRALGGVAADAFTLAAPFAKGAGAAGSAGAALESGPGTGLKLGAGDPPTRVQGPWTLGDLSRAAEGKGPLDMAPMTNKNGASMPLELHHGDQMPGAGIHEVDAATHRQPGVHGQPNQGVTPEMRRSDAQLHWKLRGKEQGGN